MNKTNGWEADAANKNFAHVSISIKGFKSRTKLRVY
jgi:hypothetical protein